MNISLKVYIANREYKKTINNIGMI